MKKIILLTPVFIATILTSAALMGAAAAKAPACSIGQMSANGSCVNIPRDAIQITPTPASPVTTCPEGKKAIGMAPGINGTSLVCGSITGPIL